MTSTERQLRSLIRGFLLVATTRELWQEYRLSRAAGDLFRAACISELIDEDRHARTMYELGEDQFTLEPTTTT